MPSRVLVPLLVVFVLAASYGLVELGRTLERGASEPVLATAVQSERVAAPAAVLDRPPPDPSARVQGVAPSQPPPARRAESVRVEGRVLGADGAPAADAMLLLGVDALYPLADARPVGHTDEHGALVFDVPVEASDRNVAQHLFALTRDGLAWTKLRVEESTTALRLGDFRAARTRTIVARVQDEEGNVLGGAEVEARARFFPIAGLFDAEEPGFEPDDRVLALFRARTDGAGNATFEHLPAPLDAGIYEFTASVPGLGRGSTLLERPSEAEGAPPLWIVVGPPR